MGAALVSIRDEWDIREQLWDIYTVGYYSAVKKKKKILPFATVWTDPENIM